VSGGGCTGQGLLVILRPQPKNLALQEDASLAREYYVYIMTNRSGTLYTGVTNNLIARAMQHKNAETSTFTGRYKLDRLVNFESTTDISVAIAREKQIKGWTRQKKIALIAPMNPKWLDLSDGWYDDQETREDRTDPLDSSAAASE
jgi:putative endonuclease